MTAARSLKVALTTAACVFFLSCSDDSNPITPPPLPTPVVPSAVLSRVTIEGDANLTGVGQTTQLKATAFYSDGTSADVTNQSTWTSDFPAVIAVSSSGLASAGSLGIAPVSARFQNRGGFLRVTATPPGTLAVYGTVREPGQGGGRGIRPADVRVFEPGSGASMLTDDDGRFNLGGLTSLRVRFERADLEPREVDLSSPSFNDVAMQRVVRISAGQTATPVPLAPFDVKYTMNGGEECFPCRMIRIDLPASGTLQLRLRWTTAAPTLGLWVNGVLYRQPSTSPSDVDVSVPVSHGQCIVFVEGFNLPVEGGVHVGFTLETSYSP